jgi:hypothetical protein
MCEKSFGSGGSSSPSTPHFATARGHELVVEAGRLRCSAPAAQTHNPAIASIRRLCCLGLGSQIAVPAILGELHALIPSYSNQFFWAGPNQELFNLYDEGDVLLPIIPLYMGELHNKREMEVVFTFTETMRRRRRSEVMRYRENTLKVDERNFENHDFYNLAMRQTGLHDALQLTVTERGRSVGPLTLVSFQPMRRAV